MEAGYEAIAFAVIAHPKLLAQHQVVGGDEGPLRLAQPYPQEPVCLVG